MLLWLGRQQGELPAVCILPRVPVETLQAGGCRKEFYTKIPNQRLWKCRFFRLPKCRLTTCGVRLIILLFKILAWVLWSPAWHGICSSQHGSVQAEVEAGFLGFSAAHGDGHISLSALIPTDLKMDLQRQLHQCHKTRCSATKRQVTCWEKCVPSDNPLNVTHYMKRRKED